MDLRVCEYCGMEYSADASVCPICGRHLFKIKDHFLCSVCHKFYSISETSISSDPLISEEQKEIITAYKLYHMC